MTATTKPVVFSWLPKGGGKGGQFSNATSHDGDTDFLAVVNQFYATGGRWVGKCQDIAYGAVTTGYKPLSLHIFNSYRTVAQTIQNFLMISSYNSSLQRAQRGFMIDSGGSGTYTVLDTETITTAGYFGGPTVFQTVKNKCYATDGGTFEGTVGGLIGPRIYYDQAGGGNGLVGVNWGLPTPQANLQVSPDPASYQQGTCTTTTSSPTITAMSFNPNTNLAVGMPFYIETSAGSGQYYEFTIASVDTPTQITLTTNWIGAGYAGAKCQGNFGSMSFGNSQPNIVVGTATTNASVNVTSISGFDAQVYCKVGYRLLIETQAGSQIWNTYIISSIVSATAVQVQGNTVESYAGARIRVDLPASTSGISADSSYQYAYSYYDSARGHIGNPSPVFTVNWGPPFNKRVNILVQNIQNAPLKAITGRTNDWTYDKIILWRTGANGALLASRALLNKASPFSFQSFTDNLSDDTQLGIVGPGSAGVNRRTVHAPPPDDLQYICYWENRFFGASTKNPGLLFWTATAGEEIDNYGVPEECWPPLNSLPIPETDGIITGIKTVGASMIVITQNNLYSVDYNTTNATSLFRLKRLSAKGAGSYHFATATMPGEDANSGDILVHFGNDRRLYLLYGAGGDIPISFPIQDILNTVTDPTSIRVGVRHDPNATYIVLATNGQINTFGRVFYYDVDRKVWFPMTTPDACFVEGNINGTLTAYAADSISTLIYKTVLSGVNAVVPAGVTNSTFEIKTQYFTPPGLPRLDEKELIAVVVYVSNLDSGNYPVVTLNADEGLNGSYSTNLVLTPIDTIANPLLKMLIDTPNAYIYFPSSQFPFKGRTFQIQVRILPVTTPPIVYEIMGIFSAVSDSGAGGIL